MKVVVVGAGFAGATVAARHKAAGDRVRVYDCRDHIAGNAYDKPAPTGTGLIHVYGPHLLHHSSQVVHEFLSRYTEWIPYEHKVKALLPSGKLVPMPPNLETIAAFTDLPAEEYLAKVRVPHEKPGNLLELAEATYGPEIANVLFKFYTEKMWAKPATQVPVSVGKRLPIRLNHDDRYFLDEYQYLPKAGYTALIGAMLEGCQVQLNTFIKLSDFDKLNADIIYYSGRLDQLFDYCLGELEFRQVEFSHQLLDPDSIFAKYPTINFTSQPRFTRVSCWSHITGTSEPWGVWETPKAGGDMYPNGSEALQRAYEQMLPANVIANGRCANYVYRDMWAAVAYALNLTKHLV